MTVHTGYLALSFWCESRALVYHENFDNTLENPARKFELLKEFVNFFSPLRADKSPHHPYIRWRWMGFGIAYQTTKGDNHVGVT